MTVIQVYGKHVHMVTVRFAGNSVIAKHKAVVMLSPKTILDIVLQ